MKAPAKANGQADVNKLLETDRSAHDWYRFVLSFPPQLVREYIDRFSIRPGQTVLDPFCGTGTTLVECKKLGIASFGIEPNLMAHLASSVKTDWDINPRRFLEEAETFAQETSAVLESEGLSEFAALPLFQDMVQANGRQLRTLGDAQWPILSKDFISPRPLHRVLTLLSTIEASENHRFAGHEKVAIAKALVTEVGNVSFGPEIGRSVPKEDAPVVSTWLRLCRTMSEDLNSLRDRANIPTTVVLGDSRAVVQLPRGDIDCVITSPPYPNEKDYTRTTRLESVVLGLVKDRSELRRMKSEFLRSNTRNVFVADDDDQWVRGTESVERLAREIERRRVELGKTSGFERLYHRVVQLYFGGLKRHLHSLRLMLRPGAHCAYVLGDQMSYLLVHIKTGQIFAEIAETLGYQVEAIELWRTRLATATKQQLREEVVILRWPG